MKHTFAKIIGFILSHRNKTGSNWFFVVQNNVFFQIINKMAVQLFAVKKLAALNTLFKKIVTS